MLEINIRASQTVFTSYLLFCRLICLCYAQNLDLESAWDGGRWWNWCNASPNWGWKLPLTSDRATLCGTCGMESLCQVRSFLFCYNYGNIFIISNGSDAEVRKVELRYHVPMILWTFKCFVVVFWYYNMLWVILILSLSVSLLCVFDHVINFSKGLRGSSRLTCSCGTSIPMDETICLGWTVLFFISHHTESWKAGLTP